MNIRKLLRVKSRPVMLSMHASIHEVITKMIDHKVSCLLFYDSEEYVVGMLTERDVLRKLVTLSVEDKLDYRVSTIMTRTLYFVHKSQLIEDINRLHAEHGIRHFPVVEAEQSAYKMDDITALLTTTDFARLHLEALSD